MASAPDADGPLRPGRSFDLSSSAVLRVVSAAAAFSSRQEVEVTSVVSAFRGGWVAPTQTATDPEQDEAARARSPEEFANEFADILFQLERAKKISIHPNGRSTAALCATQLSPLRRVTDDPRDPPDTVDTFLDECDIERIGANLDPHDISWTLERLEGYRVHVERELCPAPIAAASLLPTITIGNLHHIIAAGMMDHRRRTGIPITWLMSTLNLRAEEQPALEALIEEAVHDGKLSAVDGAKPPRWTPGGPQTKRGLGRMLDYFRWADRRGDGAAAVRARRVDLADALTIGKGDVTTQTSVLLAFGLLGEDGEYLHADPALLRVIEMLANNTSTPHTTIRRVVAILRDGLCLPASPVKREYPLPPKAFAEVPERLDDETLWIMADDLLPKWLEEVDSPGQLTASPDQTYSGGSRPYTRAPYRTRVRLTSDAFTLLRRCMICGTPWGDEPLVSGIVGDWRYSSAATGIIHVRCSSSDVAVSALASALIRADCARCKAPFQPIDPGPVQAHHLKTPDLGAYVDGWSVVRGKLERYLAEAEKDSHSEVVKSQAARLREKLARIDAADLRDHQTVEATVRECQALSRLVILTPLGGTVEHRPSRGKPLILYADEMRAAVSDVDRQRPRAFELQWAEGLIHRKCP